MHAHHQSPSTIPKDPIDDHEIYTMSKRGKIKRIKKYTLSFPSLPVQRNPHLTSAIAGFLSSPSATASLHTIHKNFTLIYPSTSKSETYASVIHLKNKAV